MGFKGGVEVGADKNLFVFKTHRCRRVWLGIGVRVEGGDLSID